MTLDTTDIMGDEAAPAAPKGPKETPLQALRRNPNALADVIWGPDHPMRGTGKGRRNTAAERPCGGAAGASTIGDLVGPSTRSALNALKWRLENRKETA